MPQLINKYCKLHTNAANVPTKKLRFSFRSAKVLLFSELCKFFSCFLHFSSQIHLSRPSIRSGVLLNDAFCARKFAYPKFLLYLCIRFSSYGILWLQCKQKQPSGTLIININELYWINHSRCHFSCNRLFSPACDQRRILFRHALLVGVCPCRRGICCCQSARF